MVQDWCPAFSIAGGGEVRFLDGSGANGKPHSAAVACCTAPKGLPPVRVGRAAYVERGCDDGAARVLRCRPLALSRILTFSPIIIDAVMARRARQDTSGRLCADRSALSLYKIENP